MESITNEIFRALGYLFISYVVSIAWTQALINASGGRLKEVLWKGFLICGSLALFASLTLGNPNCDEGLDPLRGGCDQYTDNAYQPTEQQRVANFAYFMTLLYLPVVLGAFKGKNTLRRE